MTDLLGGGGLSAFSGRLGKVDLLSLGDALEEVRGGGGVLFKGHNEQRASAGRVFL